VLDWRHFGVPVFERLEYRSPFSRREETAFRALAGLAIIASLALAAAIVV
jgi:hypothetical protein